LRATANLLEGELAKEPAPILTDQQRSAITRQVKGRRRPLLSLRLQIVSIAAALVVVGFLLSQSNLVLLKRSEQPAPYTYSLFGSVEDERAAAPRTTIADPALRPTSSPAPSRDWAKKNKLADSSRELLEQLGYVGHDGKEAKPDTTFDTEAYDAVAENPFRLAGDEPLSTFSIDVDTASYANARRFLNQGQLPPPSSVRIEEFVNYFRYDLPAPDGDLPFSVTTEVASCPWEARHLLVRVGLKGREISKADRAPSNLVFLLDVSGSMNSPDKLPLLVRSMKLLVEQLDERDRFSIVVYAGASGLVLEPTSGHDHWIIMNALDRLSAGGSTNGGAGIELAYRLAQDHFVDGGTNRVILATDGDFNVGVTDQGSLVDLIEEKRASGVFLSVLGFGQGNLKDSTMEKLADQGNGNYAYIDSIGEARKCLVEQMGGTLIPIAKDVKIQVEFNPREVQAWRQIGYENRALAHQDFNDDTKDAGEIGAGHTVTALYEVVPVGAPLEENPAPQDPLRYRQEGQPAGAAFSGELLFLKLRYKLPESETSNLITAPVTNAGLKWHEATQDFRFAAAVAGFGMLLRNSRHIGDLTYSQILDLAAESRGEDPSGYRAEFMRLVEKAGQLGNR